MYSQYGAFVTSNHHSELAPCHGTSVVDHQFAIKTKILKKIRGPQEKGNNLISKLSKEIPKQSI